MSNNKSNADKVFAKLTGQNNNNNNAAPNPFSNASGISGFPKDTSNVNQQKENTVENKAEKTEKVEQVVVETNTKKSTKQSDFNIVISKPDKVETRSQRFNGSCKPSTYKKAKSKAKRMGTNFNEVLNQFLEQFVEDEE